MELSQEEGFGRVTRQKPVVNNSPRKSIHGVLKRVLTWAALSEVLISLVPGGTPSLGVFAKSLVHPKKARAETIEKLSLVPGILKDNGWRTFGDNSLWKKEAAVGKSLTEWTSFLGTATANVQNCS